MIRMPGFSDIKGKQSLQYITCLKNRSCYNAKPKECNLRYIVFHSICLKQSLELTGIPVFNVVSLM